MDHQINQLSQASQPDDPNKTHPPPTSHSSSPPSLSPPSITSSSVNSPSTGSLTTPLPLTPFKIVSFNVGGLLTPGPSREKKISTILHIAHHCHIQIVLLQETHLGPLDNKILPSLIPQFNWFHNPHAGSRGVAIGVKPSFSTALSSPISDPHGSFISLKVPLSGQEINIISFYLPPPGSMSTNLIPAIKSFFNDHLPPPNELSIIGGDFNLTPSDPYFRIISDNLAVHNISFIPNPFPSRLGSTRSIDHFAISDRLTQTQPPILFAHPPPLNDHAPLLLIQARAPRPPLHLSIPPHIATHPAFVRGVKEGIPKYEDWNGSPASYLSKLNETAMNVYRRWRREPPPDASKSTIDLYWETVILLRTALKARLIPQNKKSRIHNEIVNELRNKPEHITIPFKVWRKKAKAEYIALINDKMNSYRSFIQPHLQVPAPIIDPFKSTPLPISSCKTVNPLIIIDPDTNLPCPDPRRKQDILGVFWSNILGSTRPHHQQTLSSLLQDYPKLPENINPNNFLFSQDTVDKIVNKSNKSSTGPDGIPFCLYSALSSHTSSLWMDLCMGLGRGQVSLPAGFTDSRLVLIPKKDHAVLPQDTRPISITNASYRIVMKIWAGAFRRIASDLLPPPQRALLENRQIDDCVDDISNWYKALHQDGQHPFLLQTDFQKAFDFVNREAILHILHTLRFPPMLKEVASLALAPSRTTLVTAGAAPTSFASTTGVKQGCPLSPIIFIIAFDVLNFHLSKILGVSLVRSYMDDIALITTEGNALTTAREVIESFCQAVGAELNLNKCYIISPSPPPFPFPLWEQAIYSDETEYLGFLLSHRDDDHNNWERRLPLMDRASFCIKSSPSASLNTKVMLTNIFVLSHIPYLARFSIIPLSMRGRVSKLLRKTLGSKSILPNPALFSDLGPFGLNNCLLHPFFLNIACLAGKRPPLLPIPSHLSVSPNMIEFKRRWAINVFYQTLGVSQNFTNADPHFCNLEEHLNWRDNIRRPSHWIYLNLLAKLPPPCPQRIPKPHINSLHFLSINLHHPLPKGPRQSFLLYLYRAWGHRAFMQHIVPSLSDRCRFDCGARETHEHFLECPTSNVIIHKLKLLYIAHPISNRSSRLIWPESKPDLLCLLGFHTLRNTSLRLYILSALRASIISKGLSMAACPFAPAVQNFTISLGKLLSSTRTHTTHAESPLQQLVTPPSIPPPESPHQAILNFDGGYDLAHGKGGAGSSLTVNGIEIAAFAETIPFGSINSAEYRALVNGKILAIRNNIKQLHIRGDSQLTLDLERGLVACASLEVLLVYSQSMQLNHHFDMLTYEKVERRDNKRADQLAHAATISDTLGQYHVIHSSDPGRPRGRSSIPTISQINDSQIFKLLLSPIPSSQFLFPKRKALRPMPSSPDALLPPRPVNDLFFRASPFLSRPKRPRNAPINSPLAPLLPLSVTPPLPFSSPLPTLTSLSPPPPFPLTPSPPPNPLSPPQTPSFSSRSPSPSPPLPELPPPLPPPLSPPPAPPNDFHTPQSNRRSNRSIYPSKPPPPKPSLLIYSSLPIDLLPNFSNIPPAINTSLSPTSTPAPNPTPPFPSRRSRHLAYPLPSPPTASLSSNFSPLSPFPISHNEPPISPGPSQTPSQPSSSLSPHPRIPQNSLTSSRKRPHPQSSLTPPPHRSPLPPPHPSPYDPP